MVPRARFLVAAGSALVGLRIVAACSTSSAPAPTPEAGPPGETFTACEINGFISETEAGTCPEGTCQALAFDTNGARVPCCTSLVSGAAMCVDGATGDAEPGLDAPAETGADADADAEEGGPDAGADAASSSDAADASGDAPG